MLVPAEEGSPQLVAALAGPVVDVCGGGEGRGVAVVANLGPPAAEAEEGARGGPPALVPTGEGSP